MMFCRSRGAMDRSVYFRCDESDFMQWTFYRQSHLLQSHISIIQAGCNDLSIFNVQMPRDIGKRKDNLCQLPQSMASFFKTIFAVNYKYCENIADIPDFLVYTWNTKSAVIS